MIGSFGNDIVFEVSTEKVRTFDGLTMQRKAIYAEHDILGEKSVLELTGYAPTSLSFTMLLNASLGVDPLEELEILREMVVKGNAYDFVLGGEPQGENLWVIESLDEKHKVVTGKGESLIIEVSVSLKEYCVVGE